MENVKHDIQTYSVLLNLDYLGPWILGYSDGLVKGVVQGMAHMQTLIHVHWGSLMMGMNGNGGE